MRVNSLSFPLKALSTALLSAACLSTGHAALFEDAEARRAILEMRQRVDGMQMAQQRATEEMRRLGEENGQLRRSLLDLQGQIDALRSEQSKLRGQNEQLLRDAADLQKRQKDIAQGVDDRLRQFEPVKVNLDGQEFQADPAEKRDFEAALAVFRTGKFPDAIPAQRVRAFCTLLAWQCPVCQPRVQGSHRQFQADVVRGSGPCART
jgi:TolA-binding protein